jgi:hypothetical protein
MPIDRAVADGQPCGNSAIRQARGDKREHLLFACGEPLVIDRGGLSTQRGEVGQVRRGAQSLEDAFRGCEFETRACTVAERPAREAELDSDAGGYNTQEVAALARELETIEEDVLLYLTP